MFIYEDKINKKVCSDLINIFENSDKKESIDNDYTKMNQIVIDLYDPILEPYIKCLTKVKNKYIKKYIHVDKGQMPWNLFPYIKIQKYKPKECYSGWHAEAEGLEGNEKKILVFTTYLNTINKGGETEFLYQKQKIKPAEGKTIIFPAYWTHTHRGNITNETKYIITGWYTYVH
jgi:prolyl 4-hydroxylase